MKKGNTETLSKPNPCASCQYAVGNFEEQNLKSEKDKDFHLRRTLPLPKIAK